MKANRFLITASRQALGLLVALIVGATSARAQLTWDGGGLVNSWNGYGNWGGLSIPSSSTSTALIFAGTNRLAPNMNANYTIGSVTFASGAGAFTLGSTTGSTLTLDAGGISNQSTTTQTITNAIQLNTGQTWTTLTGATTAVSGAINFANSSGNNFVVDGAGNTTLSGTISGGSSGLTFTKNGPGTLTLSGANNSFNQAVTVNAGNLVLTSNNALGSSTYGNTIASGGSLHLQNNITVTEGGFNVAGTGVSGGGAIVNDSGANTLGGQINLTSNATVTSTAGSLAITGQVTGSSNLTSNGAGATTYSGGVSINSATVAVSGSGTTSFTTNQISAGGLSYTGTGTMNVGTTLALGSGALAISGTGTANFTGANVYAGAISISGAGNQNFTTQVSADSLSRSGTGTTTLAGTGNNNFNSVNVTGGTLFLNKSGGATAISGGTVTVTGATLSFGANQQLASYTNVTMGAGATMLLNNTSQTLATLNITSGTSVIDFGSGSSTLRVNTLNIASDGYLNVINWSGTLDSFFATVNPGTANLSHITINGVSGATWASADGRIYLTTPVPEPSTYGAVMMGAALGFIGWRKWRAKRRRLSEANETQPLAG